MPPVVAALVRTPTAPERFVPAPGNGEPFRAEAACWAGVIHRPQLGDVVNVVYEEKGHKTEIVIKGDPRYDGDLRRHQVQEQLDQQKAYAKAVLNGADPAGAPRCSH